MSQKKKSVEETVKNLSEEQKIRVLNMKRPNKVADYQNYEKNCHFLIEECGISLLIFNEVQKLLRDTSKEGNH